MSNEIVEKKLKPLNGAAMLLVVLLLFVISVAMVIVGAANVEDENMSFIALIVAGSLLIVVSSIMSAGFRIINPNEAIVLLFFGKYYGTLDMDGFFWINPFCSTFNPSSKGTNETAPVNALTLTLMANKKISLKAMTLNNEKQKVNDEEGNPIEIGVVVIWKIINTAKAVFNVDNYPTYISTQTDSSIRHVARLYPYDVSKDGDEKSLRGSSQEVAEALKRELQSRVDIAGIEILETRISHLAYAQEIAAAMLQRQQASAIIAARQKIVEGAVGMVEMALQKLSEKNIVVLDDERKAQMVSNLLVVLCGNKDAQPIVNSGSIF